MSAFDLRANLQDATKGAYHRVVNDINALAEDKVSSQPGGVARPALEVVAECAEVNGAIAGLLTTGEASRPAPEQREAYYKSFTTRDSVLAEFEQKTQLLFSAIDGMDENTMNEMVPGVFGSPMSRFALAQVPAMHMMYHDGQLNYIQCLHGDGEMHW